MEQFTLTDEKQAKKMGFLQMCIIVVLFSYGSPYPTNKNETVLEKFGLAQVIGFSKFYGKVGVLSWLLFHLIWKNYVLNWDFD